MAEPFAAVTNLTTLSKKLTEVITKLEKFLQDVKGDLEIKNDVTSLNQRFIGMQLFLSDSKNNPDLIKSNLFQIWVTEVTQLATECEDVADEINLIDTECGESAFDAHDLGSQIKDLLSDIEDILSKQSRYDLNSDAGNSISEMNEKSMELSRSASFVNNEQMVGHHDTIYDLSRILKNRDSGQFVISIVGMDGLGKTTIARKLFNTLSTKHFTYHAWVCAPQEFNIQDVVMSLINSMTSSHEIPKVFASVNSMIQHLRNHLSEHRSLVVIDDVPDLEAWESLQIVFPKNSNHGSKVIITMRNENVVASNNVYVHKLRYLDDVESWILFCRKALSQGTKCPSNLKQVGIEMVAKCSGLPLAIEVLGGILFKKPLTLSEWEAVRDNLYPNDELRGKNKNKLSEIDSISSGKSSYDLNADINSAISAMESLGIKLGEVLPKVRNFFRDKEDDLDIEADVVTLEKELKLIQKGFKDLEIKPDKDISLLQTWVKDVSKLAIEGEHITSLTQEATKTDLMESTRKFRAQIKELLVRSKDISTMLTHYDTKQDVGNASVSKSKDELLTIRTLTPVLRKLVKLLEYTIYDRELKNDAERLSRDLIWIQACLRDEQDKPRTKGNLSEVWLNEVRTIAIECDYVVDELLLKLEAPMEKPGCLNLRAMSCFCISYKTDLHSTDGVGDQIKKLMSDISYIKENHNHYNLNAADVASTIDAVNNDKIKLLELRKLDSYYPGGDELVVGRSEDIEYLTTKLRDKSCGFFFTSLLGMGGIGKTTLAKKLYNSLSQESFESRGWICVSKEFNTQELLMELVVSMTTASEEDKKGLNSIRNIENYLYKFLTNRCFLVVLDDVWEKDAWDSLKRALPDNNNGSRVIITTRNKEVAALNNAYVHELRYLDENESWDLFCIIVLPRGTEFPSNLKQIGNEMVTKCGGLPLAITVLAGILSGKSLLLSKWKTTRDHLSKELENDSQINAILTLSFEDLPTHLKECFLYVAMYPADTKIVRLELIRFWEAEGFIEKGEEGNAGDAAESYFEELVDRSLFLKPDGLWTDSTFKVHDLLRDLAIQEVRKMGISTFYDGKGTFDVSKASTHTRLAVYHPQNDTLAEYTNTYLQTFFYSELGAHKHNSPLIRLIQTIPERFRMLRVLVVEIFSDLDGIPSSIGELAHLRYLGFHFRSFRRMRGNYNYDIPDTIGNLKALQTLSISSPIRRRIEYDENTGENSKLEGLVCVPKTVLKLTQLKHLRGLFEFSSDEIGSLVTLETLIGITGEQWCRLDTTKLVNLRRLSLWYNVRIDETFYDNLKNLRKLHTLAVEMGEGNISLEKIFKLCPGISNLSAFSIKSQDLLSSDLFAANLQVLECSLEITDFYNVASLLGKLPQLEALRILSYDIDRNPDRLVCIDGGFAQLRSLSLHAETRVYVNVTRECMPLLEQFNVDSKITFRGPDRLQRLKKFY